MDTNDLQLMFVDILNGYSSIDTESYGAVFIKHFNSFEIGELEKYKKFYFEKAKEAKILTKKEKEDFIIKNGYWTEEKDKKIRELTSFIANLKSTKSKLPFEKQRKEIQDQIDKEKRQLDLLEVHKKQLIGLTAEEYSNKKLNDFYIFRSFFADGECTKKLFTKEDYNDLEEKEVNYLVSIYNQNIEAITEKNIKKICLSPFFLNMFFLCNDNAYEFYGQPIVKLTFNQINLFNNGKYFKNMIQNSETKPPQELYQNPEELLEWMEKRSEAEKLMEKSGKNLKGNSDTSNTMLFGASKKDLKDMGLDKNVVNLGDIAKKKGKETLDMNDMLEIMG